MNHGGNKPECLTIALDYDDTFTAAPELWRVFLNAATVAGHRVVCITGRRESFAQRRELERAFGPGVDVHFAYDMPKRMFAESKGLSVDIWIDDLPEMIAPDARVEEMQRTIDRLTDERDVARDQRDTSDARMKEALQKQMADLRSRLARGA